MGSANLALAPNNGAEILLVIRLGKARISRLTLKDFWKIFGIKMHRIGKDRCEAICQARNQNQKYKTHFVTQPEIHHLLMIADMVGPKE